MPDALLVILNGLLNLLHVEVTIADVFKQRPCLIINLMQESLSLAVGKDLINIVTSEVGRVTIFIELVDDPYLLIHFSDVFGAIVNRDFDVDIVLNNESTVVGQLNHLLIQTIHDLLHDDYRHYRGQGYQSADETYSKADLAIE